MHINGQPVAVVWLETKLRHGARDTISGLAASDPGKHLLGPLSPRKLGPQKDHSS